MSQKVVNGMRSELRGWCGIVSYIYLMAFKMPCRVVDCSCMSGKGAQQRLETHGPPPVMDKDHRGAPIACPWRLKRGIRARGPVER
jgi:hypothetical protein